MKLTAKENLVLEPELGLKHESGAELPPMEGKPLFLEGKRQVVVFDTIASVKSPLYLAKPSDPSHASELVGRKLESRK